MELVTIGVFLDRDWKRRAGQCPNSPTCSSPRKYSSLEVVLRNREEIETMLSEKKKKRGRPQKHPLSSSEPRKRGRSRKYPIQQVPLNDTQKEDEIQITLLELVAAMALVDFHWQMQMVEMLVAYAWQWQLKNRVWSNCRWNIDV